MNDTVIPKRKVGRPKKIIPVVEAAIIQKEEVVKMNKVFQERKTTLMEIYSNTYVFEYQLLTPHLQTLHPFFRCKDYYHDLFYTMHTGHTGSVYGYNTKYISDKKHLLDNKEFILAIRYRLSRNEFSNAEFEGLSNLEENLNTICNLLGFNPCTVKVVNEENYVLINFDTKWTSHQMFISLFTTFVRLFSQLSYKFTTFDEFSKDLLKMKIMGDISYLINVKDKIAVLDKMYDEKILDTFSYSSWNKTLKTSTYFGALHNSGFRTILQSVSNFDKNKTFKDLVIEIEEINKRSKEPSPKASLAGVEEK